MTQPSDNATPSGSGQSHLGELTLAAALLLLTSHAAEALRFEHAAALEAHRQTQAPAADLLRWITQLWVQRFGSLTAPIDPVQASGITAELAHRLHNTTRPDPTLLLEQQAEKAVRLGARQGAADVGVTKPLPVEVSKPTLRLATDAATKVAKRYDDTQRLLKTQPITTHADVVTILAPTQAAAADVDAASRTITNTALNEGLAKTAEHHGADLLWFAEPDACVVCAALAGSVVAHTDDFDESLTFGRKPTSWYRAGDGPLRPPRHPRCRCRCEVWLGHAGPPGSMSLPDALKREAKRAIILGFALDSEPDSVRRDAADRLLKRGTALPKSVQARARRRVASDDKFKQPVPTGE